MFLSFFCVWERFLGKCLCVRNWKVEYVYKIWKWGSETMHSKLIHTTQFITKWTPLKTCKFAILMCVIEVKWKLIINFLSLLWYFCFWQPFFGSVYEVLKCIFSVPTSNFGMRKRCSNIFFDSEKVSIMFSIWKRDVELLGWQMQNIIM